MSKGEINKEAAIKSILSDLKKGIDKKTILHRIAQKCNKDRTTLHRWFFVAEKQYIEYQKRTNPAKEKAENDAVYEATKEAVKSGILSKFERMELLSKLAKGEIPIKREIVTHEGIVEVMAEPTAAERKACIAELNKMEGDYAPVKSEINLSGNITNISEDDLLNEIEALKKELFDE